MCLRLDEDEGHLFFRCKLVKRVWRGLLLEDARMTLLECPNPMVVLDHLWTLKQERRDLALLMMWEWWNVCNKVKVGDKVKPCEEVCFAIIRHYQDFCMGEESPDQPDMIPDVQTWSRPQTDFVNINFDAAFHVEEARGARGCVVTFIAACAGRLDHIASPLQAEETACVKVVEVVNGLGVRRKIFESDSLPLMNTLKCGEYDMSSIAVFFREIGSLCVASFDVFEFIFVREIVIRWPIS